MGDLDLEGVFPVMHIFEGYTVELINPAINNNRDDTKCIQQLHSQVLRACRPNKSCVL